MTSSTPVEFPASNFLLVISTPSKTLNPFISKLIYDLNLQKKLNLKSINKEEKSISKAEDLQDEVACSLALWYRIGLYQLGS
jgi:hypothetical protein